MGPRKVQPQSGVLGVFPEVSPWATMLGESSQRMGCGLGYSGGGAFLEDGLGSSEDRLWAGVLEGVLREWCMGWGVGVPPEDRLWDWSVPATCGKINDEVQAAGFEICLEEMDQKGKRKRPLDEQSPL